MALNLGTLSVIFTSDTRGLERGFRRAEKAFDRLERKSNNLGKTLNRNIDKAEQNLESLGAKARHTSAELEGLGNRGRAPIADFDRKLKRLSGSLTPVNAKARSSGMAARAFAGSLDALGGAAARVVKNFNRFVGKMRVVSFTLGSLIGVVIALKDELAALGATAAGVFVNVQLEPIRERMQSISDTTAQAERRLNELSDRAAEAGANFFTMGSQMGDAVAALTSTGGMGFDQARETAGRLTDAVVSLGGSSSDAGQRLEDMAEAARQGSVSMADLQELASFTNNPIQTLADAFDVSTKRIEQFIEAEQDLSLDSLLLVSRQFDELSQDNDTLTGAFNRTLQAAEELFETFNQQGGVIDALIGQLNNLTGLLRSDVAEDAMLYLADVATTLISDTLPSLAQSFVKNWDTILTTVKSVAGFLVGSAVGGVPGGIIGAIIAGTGNTKRVLSALGGIATGVASTLNDVLGPAFQAIGDTIAFVLEKLVELGEMFSDFLSGPDTPEEKLAATREELNNLIEARKDLKETMEDEGTARGQSRVDEKRLEAINERIERLRKLEESLEATKALAGGGKSGDGGIQITITEPSGPVGVKGVNVGKPMGVAPGFEKPGPGEFAEVSGTALDTPGGPADRLSPRARQLRDQFNLLIRDAERVEAAGESIGDSFASALNRAVIEGEKLSDVLNQLGMDIAQTVLQKGVSEPLAGSITTGAQDLAGILFGGGGGLAGASAMGATQGVRTSAFSGVTNFASTGFAEGGVTNKPAVFGEAGPEAAVPLPDGRNIPVDMKGGGTQVNIINKNGDDAQPEVSRRQDGNTEIVDVVIPMVKSAFAAGEMDPEMRKRYGTKPKPQGRS